MGPTPGDTRIDVLLAERRFLTRRCRAAVNAVDQVLAAKKDARRAAQKELQSHPSESLGGPDPLAECAQRHAFETLAEAEFPALIIVEDDSDDFILLRRALWRAGGKARVWWAKDARDALLALEDVEAVATGICVVIDVCLLGTNGFELFEQLKRRTILRPIKFAFITGLFDPGVRERAYALGADAFFIKNSDPAHLAQIASALEALASAP